MSRSSEILPALSLEMQAKTSNVFMSGLGSGYVQPDLQAAADLQMNGTSKASELWSL